MKKIFFIALQFAFTFFIAQAQLPKLYINLVSHNEENYTYLSSPPSFYSVRPKIIQMAQLATVKGAKWHLGSDHIMLRAVIKYDTGTVQLNSNGENVLKYISSTYMNNVECDPHAHESTYNNADVAKLHDSLGVNPGTVMSGFLYSQLQSGHDWQDYQNPVPGVVFPNYTWAPEILWGAATPAHTNDPVDYGMWKPQSMTSFFNHEPSNHLINYGQGCKIEVHDTTNITNVMNEIRYIVNAIQSGSAPANGFYCTSIFFRESYLSVPNFINVKMDDLMDSINVLVSQNKVEWKFIPEVVTNWKNNYNSQPFILDCDLTLVTTVLESHTEANQLNVYPNPFNNFTTIQSNSMLRNAELTLYNVFGQKEKIINRISGNEIKIDRDNLASGIYLIRLTEDNKIITQSKLVITD